MTARNSLLLTILGLFNIGVWLAAAILFRGHPVQLGAAFLAYGFRAAPCGRR